MTVVLDASAAVELLLRTPRGRRVERHLTDDLVTAPELLDVEVCSAMARLERSGDVDRMAADDAVRRLGALPVTRISHDLIRATAWSLRDRVRVADAYYVATARAVGGGTLLTCDVRLSRASLADVTLTVVR